MLFYAVSGEVPDEPVVSKKSGLLFEKRLIETYISVGFSFCVYIHICTFFLGFFALFISSLKGRLENFWLFFLFLIELELKEDVWKRGKEKKFREGYGDLEK